MPRKCILINQLINCFPLTPFCLLLDVAFTVKCPLCCITEYILFSCCSYFLHFINWIFSQQNSIDFKTSVLNNNPCPFSSRTYGDGPDPHRARGQAVPEDGARLDRCPRCCRVRPAGCAAAAARPPRPYRQGGLLRRHTSTDSRNIWPPRLRSIP